MDGKKDEKQQQSGLDMDVLSRTMRQSVIEGMATVLQQEQERARAQQHMPPARSTPSEGAETDALGQLLKPYLDARDQQLHGVMRGADLEARGAVDMVEFYLGNPEATKYRSDLEAVFQETKKNGHPMRREDIWYWFRGKNADKLRADDEKAQQEQVELARKQAVLRGGVSPHTYTGPLKHPLEMSDEELEQVVKGMSF